MYTVDALYRLLQKKGPVYFRVFIEENPQYAALAKEALKLAEAKIHV